MPGYRGHLAGGFFVYIVIVFLLLFSCWHPTFLTLVEWAFFALAGSLFPDVDIKSKGQKYFYRIVTVLLIFFGCRSQWHLVMMIGFMALLPVLVPHRGLFHRLWFVIFLPLSIAYAISLSVPSCTAPLLFNTIFFIAGAISHLWLDFGFKRMLRF